MAQIEVATRLAEVRAWGQTGLDLLSLSSSHVVLTHLGHRHRSIFVMAAP